ncbi:hypothetical protein ACH5RR_003790 [Cinchona calisaya]|uniref:Glutamate receptor n=1 Tax=Cinchona calisaya TaxID=153742 RepID=A0ABD3AVV0_9GENT
MLNIKSLLLFSLYALLSLMFGVNSIPDSNEFPFSAKTTYSFVHVGAVLDLNSPMGTMLDLCLSMAVSDFYSIHSDYKTRLFLHTKNAEEELDVASAVLEMLKNQEVHGVLGPEWSKEATFVVELGAKAHVPIISFTAKNRAFSHSPSPYFVRTTPDDLNQVKSLAAICQGFEWHEVFILYEDTEYGNLFVSKLNKAFQEVDIQLSYMSAISTSAEDFDITKELNKLMTKQTRIFLVHMNILLGNRLFVLARKAGMMSEGYAWLITDGLSNFLNSEDSSSMEGVLGIRPHVPKSKNLDNFRAKWKRKALLMKPESTVMELNVYGLWAYDTVWALALAIEKLPPPDSDMLKTSQVDNKSDISTSLGDNRSDISSLKVSQFGRTILTELLHTKFTGLSGEFQLVDGQLQPSAFEIFNVIGSGDRVVGYWTPERGISNRLSSIGDPTYSTSMKELRAIMWPGDTVVPPKGWAIPTAGKFKVGVPKKDGFTEFVNIQLDPATNEYNFSGLSIDVFLASLNLIPFKLDYEFVPYLNTSEHSNGSYHAMLDGILDKTYDFVVGDVTILANRSTFIDFTLPYTESGVVMVVKNRKNIDMWIFLKPLRWDLWMTIILACIFIGFVVRILEDQRNNTNADSLTPNEQQLGLFFWFPIAALAFPERNMVANKWSMFVLVVWLFVAYILMQSYTAKLSAIFTVDQLNFAFSKDYYIGYQHGSFVHDFLINELYLDESKLRSYSTIEEYHDAMSRGGKKGGIDAIYAEIPYMKLLLNTYGSEYRIIGPTHKTDGFGFAFPRGSPLVSYFSRAILNVTQGASMNVIEQKNFGPGYPSDQDSINQESPSLTFYNFGGPFIIILSATIIALFCSKTSIGQRFTTMVSNCGCRCSNFLNSRDKESRGHSLSHTDGAGDASGEEANQFEENSPNVSQGTGEIRESEDTSADISGRSGEVLESSRTTMNAVSAGSGASEVQLSELGNAQQPESSRTIE